MPAVRPKETDAELSKIVDRPRVAWSPLHDTLRYRAALIMRNVLYRDWNLDAVEFELSLFAGSEWAAKEVRKRDQKWKGSR